MQKRGVFVLFILFLFLLSSSVFAKPLYIVSYCDVTLESCKTQDQALALLQEKYPFDIHVDYLYYFDTSDVQSSLAHIALECAHKQSKKESYKAELQDNLAVITRASLKDYANTVGLVAANFSFCLDTQSTAWDVLEQLEEADDDGITIAPSVRFNMDIYTGSQTFTSLHELAKEYLQLDGSEQTLSPEEYEEVQVVSQEVEEADEEAQGDHEATETESPEKTYNGTENEGQEELDTLEQPLFFRVISKFRNWMLGIFT